MHHFSAIISKVQEFVQNRVFSPRSARFLIVALGTLLFSDFSQSAGVWCKTAFLVRDQDVLSFSHCAHYFLAIFSKVQEFVQNTVFIARTARFVIFAPGAPLFSDFQQSARVCTKQKFSSRDQQVLLFSH